MTPPVITLGESLVLLLAEQTGPLSEATTFRRHIAGAESNLAIGLARLGHQVGWFGRVGDDEFGRAILFRLRGEGVDITRAIVDSDAPTAVMFRDRREVGPIEVAYYRRGCAGSRLTPADLDHDYIVAARYLHLTGITPALSAGCREAVFAAAEIARAAGVTVVLDPNIRLKLWAAEDARRVLRDLAARCDVLLPGADEAELLTGVSDPAAAAAALLELGPTLVVVKAGAEGSIALGADAGEPRHTPAHPLERVVDPVGAGDAFAAGLLSGFLRGWLLADALALANRCGAAAMVVAGDAEALPTWAELDRLSSSAGDVRR